MNTYIKHLAPISLSALLIACGSGGGKGDNHQTTNKDSSKASPQANLVQNKEETVEVTSTIIKQTKPTDSILNKPSAETVVTPSLTTKKLEKPTTPALNKPSTEKVVTPILTAKELEKPATPILNKPSTETVATPALTAKEQEKQTTLTLNKPNTEKVVAPNLATKEPEKPATPILNKPSTETVFTPPLTAKEPEKQTTPTLNKPNTEKVVSPNLATKEPEKPANPILNKPSTETVFTPPLTAKEPEKQTTLTLNKPSTEMVAAPIPNKPSTETIVAPTLEDKEQEMSATPDSENLASSESIKNSETIEPLDIPTEINKLTNTWFAGGNSEYSKDGVRVYKLIENDRNYADDPNFKEKKLEYIQLKQGTNSTSDYTLTLLDDNVYYGFYRDSIDMFKVDNHYVYSFNERAENKGDLSQLTATYRGRFVYSLRSNPNLATSSDVHLTYTKGQAEGKIYSRQVKNGEQGRELFDIKTNNGDLRLLELNPLVTDLDNSIHGEEVVVRKNSPDRIILETHFINGQDGTENKHIVGKGGNEKYWGVLGAGKVEE